MNVQLDTTVTCGLKFSFLTQRFAAASRSLVLMRICDDGDDIALSWPVLAENFWVGDGPWKVSTVEHQKIQHCAKLKENFHCGT